MNVFNKYEVIGIFLSIIVMVLALSTIRFKSDVFALNDLVDSETQGAVVAVSHEGNDIVGERTKALLEASDSKELVRLVVDDVRIGKGEVVKSGDTLTVNYVGKTQDGIKFDSSYDRGAPYVFTIGAKKVIEGWEKGLIGMRVGGQRILVIPSEMAYGNRQVGSIAPNSALVFEVELLSLEK